MSAISTNTIYWAPVPGDSDPNQSLWPVECTAIVNDMAQVKYIGVDQQGFVHISYLLPFASHLAELRARRTDDKFQWACNEAEDLHEFLLAKNSSPTAPAKPLGPTPLRPSLTHYSPSATARSDSHHHGHTVPELVPLPASSQSVDDITAEISDPVGPLNPDDDGGDDEDDFLDDEVDDDDVDVASRGVRRRRRGRPRSRGGRPRSRTPIPVGAGGGRIHSSLGLATPGSTTSHTSTHGTVLNASTARSSGSRRPTSGSLIGQTVVVGSGRWLGRSGVVIKGANGYLHIQLHAVDSNAELGADDPVDGIILKRANELHLPHNEHSPDFQPMPTPAIAAHDSATSINLSATRKRRHSHSRVSYEGTESSLKSPGSAQRYRRLATEEGELFSQRRLPVEGDLESDSESDAPVPISDFVESGHDESIAAHNVDHDEDDEEEEVASTGSTPRVPTSNVHSTPAIHHGYQGPIAIGQSVTIASGRGAGERGQVVRSGHGFYAVVLDSTGEEVMKRAVELDSGGFGSHVAQSSHPQTHHAAPSHTPYRPTPQPARSSRRLLNQSQHLSSASQYSGGSNGLNKPTRLLAHPVPQSRAMLRFEHQSDEELLADSAQLEAAASILVALMQTPPPTTVTMQISTPFRHGDIVAGLSGPSSSESTAMTIRSSTPGPAASGYCEPVKRPITPYPFPTSPSLPSTPFLPFLRV